MKKKNVLIIIIAILIIVILIVVNIKIPGATHIIGDVYLHE